MAKETPQSAPTPEYGSWVPKKSLATTGALVGVCVALLAASVSPLAASWAAGAVWMIRGVAAIGFVAGVVFFFAMLRAYRAYSPAGGGVSAKVLGYLVGRVEWDGAGKALDIGCGNGALTVRLAKKYPGAAATGLDLWGPDWDYSKAQCETNARLEGVADQIDFVQGDAADLPFADGAFDLVVGNLVFHEVKTQPDKRQLIAEALRVVKPGGRFVLHDLFLDSEAYGREEDLARWLAEQGCAEIHLEATAEAAGVPKHLRTKLFLKNIAMVHGVK